jgi:hypothetical protein
VSKPFLPIASFNSSERYRNPQMQGLSSGVFVLMRNESVIRRVADRNDCFEATTPRPSAASRPAPDRPLGRRHPGEAFNASN